MAGFELFLNRETFGFRPARRGIGGCTQGEIRFGFALDLPGESDCIAVMKPTILAAYIGLVFLAAGCASAGGGKKTAAVPFVKDKIEAQYPRPMAQVYQAALEVIQFNGTVANQSLAKGTNAATNNTVKTIEGRINQRTVWIRVEPIEPSVTVLTVQTRAPGGGSDLDLAAMIDKQIMLKLAR